MNNLDTPTVIGIFENRLPAFSFYFYKILWQSFHAKFEYTHSAEADLEQHKQKIQFTKINEENVCIMITPNA